MARYQILTPLDPDDRIALPVSKNCRTAFHPSSDMPAAKGDPENCLSANAPFAAICEGAV